jgi:hypothetical protein
MVADLHAGTAARSGIKGCSVEISTPCRDQRARGLTCQDVLSIARRLSLLRGLVRPKSGQPANEPHCQLGNLIDPGIHMD